MLQNLHNRYVARPAKAGAYDWITFLYFHYPENRNRVQAYSGFIGKALVPSPRGMDKLEYKTASGATVNSFSNGPVVNGQPTGTPWTSPPRQAAGWAFQLLPFVEQTASQGQAAGMIRNTALAAYVCPARRSPGTKLSNGSALGGQPLDYAAGGAGFSGT